MDAGVLSGLSPSPPLSLCLCLLSLLWLASLLSLLLPSVQCRLRASSKSYHYANPFRLCKSCMRHIYQVGRAISSAPELWPSFGFKRLHTDIPGCAAGQYTYVLLTASATSYGALSCKLHLQQPQPSCLELSSRHEWTPLGIPADGWKSYLITFRTLESDTTHALHPFGS